VKDKIYKTYKRKQDIYLDKKLHFAIIEKFVEIQVLAVQGIYMASFSSVSDRPNNSGLGRILDSLSHMSIDIIRLTLVYCLLLFP